MAGRNEGLTLLLLYHGTIAVSVSFAKQQLSRRGCSFCFGCLAAVLETAGTGRPARERERERLHFLHAVKTQNVLRLPSSVPAQTKRANTNIRVTHSFAFDVFIHPRNNNGIAIAAHSYYYLVPFTGHRYLPTTSRESQCRWDEMAAGTSNSAFSSTSIIHSRTIQTHSKPTAEPRRFCARRSN